MKPFVFLYPISEIIDFEVERGMYTVIDDFDKEQDSLKKFEEAKTEYEKEAVKNESLQKLKLYFRKVYSTNLNACIDARYRKKGFEINYCVFNGSPVSDVIELQESDKVIEVGLDFKTHTTRQANGVFLYPDPDFILNQLGKITAIRIAGFHMWDCVETSRFVFAQ